MSRFILTPSALADLDSIWDHIALDNPKAADRLISAVLRKCELLADFPLAGRAREEFGESIHSYPVGNYLIYYKPIREGIEVWRVIHGARQLDEMTEN